MTTTATSEMAYGIRTIDTAGSIATLGVEENSGDGYEPGRTSASTATGTLPASNRVTPDQQSRRVMRSLVRASEDALQRIFDNQDDFVLRANSFTQFQACLSDLWGLRGRFGDAFAEIINMFQGVVQGRADSFFTPSEIVVLLFAMRRLHNSNAIDDCVANDITADLIKGGLDVFREID